MPKKTIEQIMREGGWLRSERENGGKVYIEYVRDGFLIDESDIVEEK
jgi:hypothetical protein